MWILVEIHEVPLTSTASGSNWKLEVFVFEEGGKTVVSGEKALGTRTRTNNKLNPHMTPSPGIEPGPHWWEASALTTAPYLLPWSLIKINHDWTIILITLTIDYVSGKYTFS